MKRLFPFFVAFICMFSGCTTLTPTSVTLKSPIKEYQYVYITPTSEMNSVEGLTLGGSYGIYGATTTHSINPMNVISGYFIQRGFIRVPEIKPENADKTLIVNYGEVKSGYYIDLHHGVSIVIQMISASKNELLCVCNAEGKGDSDAEAVNNAIDRCLKEFFKLINQ